MSRLCRGSLIAYRWLLVLYPDDLRRAFGSEMFEMFAHDLAAAWAQQHIRGILRVWRLALRELIGIAGPGWLRIPAVSVPALSAIAVIVLDSPLLILAIRKQAELTLGPGDATFPQTVFAIGIAAALAALTSFIAVYRWKRGDLVSLALG
ncbi:MAG TPA: hypothetical protein VG273_06915 [Bryobacteraceae bacterium]|jgi:hypothetical protein|nr:hypothetical protein [Bryobacteraceae bacterium]